MGRDRAPYNDLANATAGVEEGGPYSAAGHGDGRAQTERVSITETLMQYQSEEQKRLGVRIHAIAYVLTMIVLAVVNVFTGRPYWALWVLPGWTIGLFCHWYFVLGRNAHRS